MAEQEYVYGDDGKRYPKVDSAGEPRLTGNDRIRQREAGKIIRDRIDAGFYGEPASQQSSQYDTYIQNQLASLAAGDPAAQIGEQVQMDVLGPGYQQAEYGAAAAGVPGAGRVMRAREAVERKASIQSARARSQNLMMQHQLANAYLEQAFKNRKLDSDEAVALSELISQTMAWAHDEHPGLSKAIPGILGKMVEKGKNKQEMMSIFVSEAAIATGETVDAH